MALERKGLFLDFDGTLANSIPVMYQIYAQFLSCYNCPSSQSEFDSLNGPSFDVVIKTLKEIHNLSPSISDLTKKYFGIREELKQSIRPSLGAEELISKAIRSRYIIAIVTSSHSNDVQDWLDKFDLSKNIKTVVGGESVARGKPAPEPYLMALERTGCLAENSLAVEDSLTGILSAQSANLKTIAIGNAQSILSAQPGISTVSNLQEVTQYFK